MGTTRNKATKGCGAKAKSKSTNKACSNKANSGKTSSASSNSETQDCN